MPRGLRMSEEQLATFEQNSGRGLPKATQAEMKRQREERTKTEAMNKRLDVIAAAPRKASKYKAQPVVVDGIRFDSKLEAKRYGELKLLRIAGKIKYFLRQVPFWLPAGVIYRLDFLVVADLPDWSGPAEPGAMIVHYEDCKGFQDRVSKLKIKQVESLYGIKVRLVKKAGR